MTALKSVLLVRDPNKPGVDELLSELEPWLTERAERVELESDVRDLRQRAVEHGAPHASDGGPFDLVIVLGGDGTLLGAVMAFAEAPVPMVGINFGRVGFLAATPASRWRETLESVIAGNARVEERHRLKVSWMHAGKERRSVALNDLVLQRGSYQGMLTVSLRVGEDWVTNYRADGLIVATPSGSTGYSLSAGGPILAPAVEGILVTPICSQGLANRPIVLPPSCDLTLRVKASSGITTLAIDGQTYHPLTQGVTVSVCSHPVPFPLVAMPDLDPYRRLRSRLGWRGSLEPDVFGDTAGQGETDADSLDALPPGTSEGGRL